MHAIVSLLDEHHAQQVEALWAEMEEALGVRYVRWAIPFPHFSYQVAAYFDMDSIQAVLQKHAQTATNFRVRATGIGIFNTPRPVLYVPVAQHPMLAALHQKLWMACADLRSGAPEYYHPNRWIPHITLAQRDIVYHQLPGLVRLIGERPINWDITVNNLALIEDKDGKHSIRYRFDFGA